MGVKTKGKEVSVANIPFFFFFLQKNDKNRRAERAAVACTDDAAARTRKERKKATLKGRATTSQFSKDISGGKGSCTYNLDDRRGGRTRIW